MTENKDMMREKVAKIRDSYPNANPFQVTSKVFSQIGATRETENFFYGAVLREAKRQERNDTKVLERIAFTDDDSSVTHSTSESYAKADPLEARREVMKKHFWNGKEHVLWSESTVEDHQAAIDDLRSNIKGYEKTITVHREAVRKMERAGVEKYGELDEEVPAAAA